MHGYLLQESPDQEHSRTTVAMSSGTVGSEQSPEISSTAGYLPYDIQTGNLQLQTNVTWQEPSTLAQHAHSVSNITIQIVRSIADGTATQAYVGTNDSQCSSTPSSPIMNSSRRVKGTLATSSTGLASPMSEVTSILRAAALSTEASAKMTPSEDGDEDAVATSIPPVLGYDAIMGEVNKSELDLYIRGDEEHPDTTTYREPLPQTLAIDPDNASIVHLRLDQGTEEEDMVTSCSLPEVIDLSGSQDSDCYQVMG